MNAGPATTDIAAHAVGIGAADEPKGQEMTNPDELERAAGNLAGLARDLERYDPWGGTRSRSDAADLRLILAANRKMRKALSELCENAELARFHIGNTEGGDIVGSALWDTIGQARSALSTKEQPDV